jgi:predicted cupin superfamily sugar epimerase
MSREQSPASGTIRLIRRLKLTPHPEGGYYRETYRSAGVLPGLKRNCSTAILYLLGRNDRSCFHKIRSDELWFFHAGDPVDIYLFAKKTKKAKKLSTIRLGPDTPQAVVSGGTWFAARPAGKPRHGHSLVSCVVAPGFDFRDFTLADRSRLCASFPGHKQLIRALTKSRQK